MAIYQRSDVPFSDNLFTLPLTGDSSSAFWTSVLNSNFTTLLAAAIGGVLTNPTLSLPDGSNLTIQGTFTVTLGLGTADISGTATGLVRTTAGMTIETVSAISLPFTAHYDVLNPANNSSSAPTLQDIINGNDQLNGGSQNDLLMGFGGADAFNGGAGSDTVSYDAAPTAVRADLGNSATNTGSDAVGDTYSSIENLIGSHFDDILVGNAQANVLTGGAGNDAYFVDGAADVVIENANEGTDTVYSTANFRLSANVEVLVLQGSADLQGFGNSATNVIYGNSGSNVLDGDAGADAMFGGAGNDSYYVDNAGDLVIENAGEGFDTVYSTAHLRLGANVETLVLQGSADLQGYGNSLANSIYGNSGNNILDGDTGGDSMYGGAGSDTYFVDNAGDVVVENLNEGFDTVFSTASLTLGANVETLVLQGSADLQGYGNSLSNSLYGNSGNNILDGGTLGDAMYGGAGNDIFYVDDAGDVVVENAGAGTDAVFSTVSYTLTPDVETLVLQGSAGLQGFGNTLNNALYGNTGNNVLDGGTGADTMYGGTGDDTYFVDNTSDFVVENLSEGTDAIFSSVSLSTLAANVETLVLQEGAGNLNGTGNGLANTVFGNSGNNSLDGAGGADLLVGNAGNDTFVFHQGQGNGDTVFDFAGNAAALGDSLQFVGYGAGATFTNINATQWQVNYDLGMGLQHEIITFSNAASIDATDFSFL
jgi:trimeric autotransporter adhesin